MGSPNILPIFAKIFIMRKGAFFIVAVAFAACQTVKVKNETYKVSPATVELGSLGQSKSTFNLDNDFETRSLPKLQNKVRVDVAVLPFHKQLNKVYNGKAKYDQNLTPIHYIDSLPVKPEYVNIQLFDTQGYLNELNESYNQDVFTLIKDTKKTTVVTSVAVTLSAENIAKIKQADSYYLTNEQDRKYNLLLFKSGKKTETIDLHSGKVLAYKLSKFCWSVTDRGRWYVADIVDDNSSCIGKTTEKVKEKDREKSLFKM